MAEIVWSPQAIDNIGKIAEFVANDSPQYAKSQTNSFFDEAEVLAKYPL